MNKKIKNLEKAIKNYILKSKATDLVDEKYEENYESDEAIRAFDEAYREEQSALSEAITLLQAIIPVDVRTARKMIILQGEEIISLVSKIAQEKNMKMYNDISKRVFNIMDTYYPYDVTDCEVTVETIHDMIKDDPSQIIEILLDLINDLEN